MVREVRGYFLLGGGEEAHGVYVCMRDDCCDDLVCVCVCVCVYVEVSVIYCDRGRWMGAGQSRNEINSESRMENEDEKDKEFVCIDKGCISRKSRKSEEKRAREKATIHCRSQHHIRYLSHSLQRPSTNRSMSPAHPLTLSSPFGSKTTE